MDADDILDVNAQSDDCRKSLFSNSFNIIKINDRTEESLLSKCYQATPSVKSLLTASVSNSSPINISHSVEGSSKHENTADNELPNLFSNILVLKNQTVSANVNRVEDLSNGKENMCIENNDHVDFRTQDVIANTMVDATVISPSCFYSKNVTSPKTRLTFSPCHSARKHTRKKMISSTVREFPTFSINKGVRHKIRRKPKTSQKKISIENFLRNIRNEKLRNLSIKRFAKENDGILKQTSEVNKMGRPFLFMNNDLPSNPENKEIRDQSTKEKVHRLFSPKKIKNKGKSLTTDELINQMFSDENESRNRNNKFQLETGKSSKDCSPIRPNRKFFKSGKTSTLKVVDIVNNIKGIYLNGKISILQNRKQRQNKMCHNVFSVEQAVVADIIHSLNDVTTSPNKKSNNTTALTKGVKQNIPIYKEVRQDIVINEEQNQDTIINEKFYQDTVINEEVYQDNIVNEKVNQDAIVNEKVYQDTAINEEVYQDTIVNVDINQDDIASGKVYQDTVINEEVYQDTVINEEVYQDTVINEEVYEDTTVNVDINQDDIASGKVYQDTVINEEVYQDTVINEEVYQDTVINEEVYEDTIINEEVYEDTENSFSEFRARLPYNTEDPEEIEQQNLLLDFLIINDICTEKNFEIFIKDPDNHKKEAELIINCVAAGMDDDIDVTNKYDEFWSRISNSKESDLSIVKKQKFLLQILIDNDMCTEENFQILIVDYKQNPQECDQIINTLMDETKRNSPSKDSSPAETCLINDEFAEKCDTPKIDVQTPRKEYFPIFYPNRCCPIIQKTTRKQRTFNGELGINQRQIDAGQKSFGAKQCTQCGLVYSVHEPEEEKTHHEYHNSLHILRFSGWVDETVVSYHPEWGNFGRIIRIDEKSRLKRKERLINVLSVVDKELGFSSHVIPSNFVAFLAIRKNHIVGVCLVHPLDKANKYINLNGVDCCTEETFEAKCGISRIWVSPFERRFRIASELFTAVRCNTFVRQKISLDKIAFSAPTEDGKLFAKKVSGTENFLVYQ